MDNYTEVASLKGFLRIPDADTDDDAYLSIAIEAASRAIDKACNRNFSLASGTPSARVFSASYDADRRGYVVPIDDLMTTTGLAVAVDVDDDLSYSYDVTETPQMWPLNAASQEMPWTEMLFRDTTFPSRIGAVEVTANWGWNPATGQIPYTIEQACLIQASRLFKRREAPFGVAGSPEMGNELRLLSRLDPDVEVLVNAYKKWWA